MTAIVLVSVINHYHINGFNLFWDTLYIPNSFLMKTLIFFKPNDTSIFLYQVKVGL